MCRMGYNQLENLNYKKEGLAQLLYVLEIRVVGYNICSHFQNYWVAVHLQKGSIETCPEMSTIAERSGTNSWLITMACIVV